MSESPRVGQGIEGHIQLLEEAFKLGRRRTCPSDLELCPILPDIRLGQSAFDGDEMPLKLKEPCIASGVIAASGDDLATAAAAIAADTCRKDRRDGEDEARIASSDEEYDRVRQAIVANPPSIRRRPGRLVEHSGRPRGADVRSVT